MHQNVKQKDKIKGNVSKRCEKYGSLGGLVEKEKLMFLSNCVLGNS